jgi:hypothetical protein
VPARPGRAVLVRDLPPDIDDELLGEVGRRADAALTAVDQPLPGAAGVVLRFTRLSVFCGRAGKNVLLVLGAPTGAPDTLTTSAKAAIRVSAPALARVVEPDTGSRLNAATNASSRRRGDGIWG